MKPVVGGQLRSPSGISCAKLPTRCLRLVYSDPQICDRINKIVHSDPSKRCSSNMLHDVLLLLESTLHTESIYRRSVLAVVQLLKLRGFGF